MSNKLSNKSIIKGLTKTPNKILTLLLAHGNLRNNKQYEVLLAMKKRGFGAGKYNGFGGKVEHDESIISAALRELEEESGLDRELHYKHTKHQGILLFEFESKPQLLEVHVFSIDKIIGTPIETEEMNPKYFNINEIPYDNMWLDDIIWYPKLFNQEYFIGYFLFRGHDILLDHNLNTLTSLTFNDKKLLSQEIYNILPNHLKL